MQIAEQVDLADQLCSESISDIPIKKRLCLSWCSSSTSQGTGTMRHKCNGQPKKSSLDAESSASENDAGVVVETNIESDNFHDSPFSLSDQRSHSEGEHGTSFLHGNPTDVYQFKKGKNALKESNMSENVNPDSRLSLGLEVGKQKQFIQQQECEVLVDSRTVGVQFALCDVSASKRAETTNLHQSSCEDEGYHGLGLSKQVGVETCYLDVPQAKGMQNHQITNNHLNSKDTSMNFSAHLCVNREKWDLNVPMEVWEYKHDVNITSKLKNMQQQRIDKNLIQTIGVTIGNKSTSGSSVVEVSKCNIRAKNLRQPADNSGCYGDGLDLQLRPPSRLDLCSSSGIASVDLSLSLNVSISEAPSVKPEPLENDSPNETGATELNNVKPIAKAHVKLEQCDGISQRKASKLPVQCSLPDIMVKPEPLEELHGKSPNMPLDNKQLTTCHTEIPQNLNSNALPTDNILCDISQTTPGNANIKSVESSYLPLDLDPSRATGPKLPAKVEDAITDDCGYQDAEGSTSKSDLIAGSDLSDVKGCDEKGENIKIAGMRPSMHNKSMVSDLEKQKTLNGLSEGSADMDCSDGEDYTLPKLITGENLHANPGNSSKPSSGSKEGIDIEKIHCDGTCHTEVPQNLNSNALPTENILCDISQTTPGNANIKSVESSYLPLDLDPSRASGPKMPAKVEDAITDDCGCQDAEGSTSKSDLIAGSDLSDAKGCDEKGENIKIAGMRPSMHDKSVLSDLEKQKTLNGLSEGSADMDCSDGEDYTLPKLIAGENLHANPGNSSKPSSGSKEGIDIEKIHMQQVDVDKEHLAISYGQTCIRMKVTSPGVGEVKVEDGDPGGPVARTATEASCDYEEKGVLQCASKVPCVKSKVIANSAVDFVGSECCEPMMDIHVDVDTKGKEKCFVEADDHNTKRIGGIMCHDKRETSYKLTAGLSGSQKGRLVKSCQGELDDHLGKKKGLEMQSSPKEAYAEIAKTNKGDLGRSQMNSRYAFMSNKQPEQLERDSDVCDIANSHFHDIRKYAGFKYADNKHRYRHTEKSSPPPMRSFSNRMSVSARLISSGTLNDRWIDKQKRDQLCTQRRRPSKFNSMNRDRPIGGFESDYMNTRRNGNQHFIRDPNIQYEEELNNLRQYQLQRPNEDTEVPFNLPPNSSVRIARRSSRAVDDPRHHSRFPSWRQIGPRLPGSVRETIPGRFIGREVHDEKIMNLPDQIVDDLLYSRSNLQYDPTDRDLMPRGRSSSPIQRRPHPLRMYRSRSPCQWSSLGRTPEMAIDNHNRSEPLIRHGPPVVRVDMARSRSPCQWSSPGRTPEMARRNGSPPYAQFPVDIREMRPVNEFDLPRPSRIMQRNIRRSDLDPYENAEYIGPSHFTDQFVESRDYHDRSGLAQRLRPHHIPGHDEEDNPPYPDDDGYLRPINFCPDSEVIPATGNARNYDNHVKNRLGPAPNRLRSKAEQGEDYRYGRQDWRDGGYNDGRLKRRKF